DRAVAGHAVEPGREAADGGVVAVWLSPERDEGVLGDVLGAASVVQDRQRDRVDACAVAIIQLAKRALVAEADLADERCVQRGFGGRALPLGGAQPRAILPTLAGGAFARGHR